MNETIVGILASAITAVIMRTVDSYLKRGESKSTNAIERDKLEHEQEMQLRSELRQEIQELRKRVTEAETSNTELRRKVIALEKDVALRDTKIAVLEDQVGRMQIELDAFNRKVYYKRKEDDK